MKGPFKVQCWLKKIYRHGPRFQQHFSNLKHTQSFNPEQLKTYQSKMLQKIVHHCYQYVPYYQDLFRALKLTPESIQKPIDLEKLPLLDKKTVQENYDRLISKKHYNFLCNMGTTSGSTGMPGKFVRDFDAINFEHAVVWRHWQNAGDMGKRRISLRGEIIVPAAQNHPPFWRYNPANQELQMSSYHLSRENCASYIDKILAFMPQVLYCGPSMGHVLAKFFRHHQVDYQFDAIFTSSESLEPDVRAYIQDVFQCQIFDWYGQAERVAAIGQCGHGKYHIQEDYSVVELLPGPEPESYELVGTQLYNYVMPLLRYRTQDYVDMRESLYPQVACACGKYFRTVERILGRSYGYLLTPEGYHIAITAHIPVGVDNVIETQFYQEKKGEVILKVLTNGCFTEADRERLVCNTLQHTSPHMKVDVMEVNDIPRGPNGKFINIVNKMELLN
jgi:phenylacetate-CoA ligase